MSLHGVVELSKGRGGWADLPPGLKDAGIDSKRTIQPTVRSSGLFAKDRFAIDLDPGMGTCLGKSAVKIGRLKYKAVVANFAEHGASCARRRAVHDAALGRKVRVEISDAALARLHAEQADPSWRDDTIQRGE
jgi:hypothetical protein